MNNCHTTEKTQYEIYAIKYAGPLKSVLAMLLWMEGWDQEVERNYYCWFLKCKEEIIIVDTGCSSNAARQRCIPGFTEPLKLLKQSGIEATTVKAIIITHLHFDHGGGIGEFAEAFPAAPFYIQRKEYDFWLHNPIAHREPFARFCDSQAHEAIADLHEKGRIILMDGDHCIRPGIEVMLTPGHTAGLQAVAAETAKGIAILASDTIHIKENLTKNLPSTLITDMAAWTESCEKLRSRTSEDLIFSGHDVGLLEDYPRIKEHISRLI